MSKNERSKSRLSDILRSKKSRQDDLISTPSKKPKTSETTNVISEFSLPAPLSPMMETDVDESETEETVERPEELFQLTCVRPKALKAGNVIFIAAPVLNSVSMHPQNIRQIQCVIDNLQRYMDQLQKNIFHNSMTLKQHFSDTQHKVIKLYYADIVSAIVQNNTVHAHNFHSVSEMFFNYYMGMFNVIEPIMHAIINVNYTIGKTNISQAVTHFLNVCAHYVVFLLQELINRNTTVKNNIPAQYMNDIKKRQNILTNIFNSHLLSLQSSMFYKHTPNNDDTINVGVQPTNYRDRIISVHLRVYRDDFKLKF
uniref:Maco-A 136 n=1 Tax=Mamestra configurata nucleopolyhedrovirus TaxID=207830 RepID=A0A5B9G799_NPVMC|nr:Maco-A 136 [Mamestra configurata nucleopolyhedrovirus A]